MLDSDIAVRANLVTLSDECEYQDKIMIDYSAGEISTKESKALVKYLDKHLSNEIIKLYPGVSYRHCMIMHNAQLGTNMTPPHDISGKSIKGKLPIGGNGCMFKDLMIKSYKLLNNHPINLKRISEGKNPANSIWLWGEGVKPTLEPFKSLYKKSGVVISAVDLLKGIGKAAGMRIYEVKGATGTIHTNFAGKANATIKALNEGADFVYLHIEAPDECSHQGDIAGKIKAIELIDQKVVKRIVSALSKSGEEYSIMILPDHPTPLSTRTHSGDPVPYLIYRSNDNKVKNAEGYNERTAKLNGIIIDSGTKLMNKFLR